MLLRKRDRGSEPAIGARINRDRPTDRDEPVIDSFERDLSWNRNAVERCDAGRRDPARRSRASTERANRKEQSHREEQFLRDRSSSIS